MEHFPISPQSAYDALTAQFDLNRRPCGDGWATRKMVYDIAIAKQRLIDRAKGDPAGVLAARRAAVTLYFRVAEGLRRLLRRGRRRGPRRHWRLRQGLSLATMILIDYPSRHRYDDAGRRPPSWTRGS